jgi:hypothetical protein
MKTYRQTPVFAVLFCVAMTASALAGGQLYLPSIDPPMIPAPYPPVWSDEDFPVPFNINPGTASGWVEGPDPAQQFADAVTAAFGTWDAVATARVTTARGPDSADLLDNNPHDGVHLIVFHNEAVVQGIPIPLPAGVLGVTNTVFDGATGRMQGGSITLNPDPLPGNPDPDWSTSGDPGSIDIQAVVLHEAGHLLGLCHSAVRYDAGGEMSGQPSNAAVMFPFISPDVMDGREPDADDIAWLSFVYPSALYDSAFGAIQGDIPFGATLGGCGAPAGADGAHVVARDLNDRVGGEPRMVVGTYSYKADGDLGRYTIPGLPPGDYGIWIEPMDGSPVAALQINTRIQFSDDTDFPEDWYSGGGESGIEAAPNDPASAVEVTVSAGSTVAGIDVIVENSILPGCISRLSGDRSGPGVWAKVSSQAFLLVPIAFLLLLRRRLAAKGGRREDRTC